MSSESVETDVLARLREAEQLMRDTGAIFPDDRAFLTAVADMLRQAAMDVWAHGPLCECGTGCDACDDNLWEPHARAALVVANTYLGITTPPEQAASS